MSLAKSSFGDFPSKPSRYAARNPEVKSKPREPAAVTADWTQTFSFGPKYPPPKAVGKVFERDFRIA